MIQFSPTTKSTVIAWGGIAAIILLYIASVTLSVFMARSQTRTGCPCVCHPTPSVANP